jgi:hypothetical protein
MSVTIDSELLKFDEKLSGAIGTISSGLTTLTSKLNDLKSSNTSFSNEVSSNYSGAGKDQAISSFTSLNSVVDAISGTFAEGPLKVVEESNDLLSKISDLKKLKEDIDKLESDISKLGGRWSKGGSRTDAEVDAHNNEISNLESQKSTKETEFNTKQTEAKTKLAAIKAINPEIKISKPADIAAEVNGQIMNDIKNLAPGTYTMKTFTASNGQRITYGIYVPANASTTTGLPLHLYMTGSGEVGNVNGNSLPMLLKKGQQSSGIVVALQANSGSSYTDPKYLTAAKE